MGLPCLNVVWRTWHLVKLIKLTFRANYQLWKWKHTCNCFGENQVKVNPLQTNSYDTSQVSSWNKMFALSTNNMHQPHGKKKNKTHPTKKENYTTEKYQVRIDYKSPCRSQITYSKKLELLIRKEAK